MKQAIRMLMPYLLGVLLFSTNAFGEEKDAGTRTLIREMELRGVVNIALDSISAPVELVEGKDGRIRVFAAGEEVDQFLEVAQKDGQIQIRGKGQSSKISLTTSGGEVVVKTEGAKNQRIIINDQVIAEPESSVGELRAVTIELPSGMQLSAKGLRSLQAGVELKAAELEFSGSTTASLKAVDSLVLESTGTSNIVVNKLKDARVKFSGVNTFTVKNYMGQNLAVDLSGSSIFRAEGVFGNVKIQASGSCNSETSGIVRGDYTGEASGASVIRHRGAIKGREREKASGASRIELN